MLSSMQGVGAIGVHTLMESKKLFVNKDFDPQNPPQRNKTSQFWLDSLFFKEG
jgi:hypothetical protein